MLRELIWDSRFFRKKIGEFLIHGYKPPDVDKILDIAKNEGYEYIFCRLYNQDTSFIKVLTTKGFYLTDIGITWQINIKKLFLKTDKSLQDFIITASQEHIPELKRMTRGLFKDSRFYSDPFFSEDEADRFFEAWIESSVKGDAADIVFYYPERGFISCKKENMIGRIVLIGVVHQWWGKGIGRALIERAGEWFNREGIEIVHVRTQLKNINAMKFYSKLGFMISGYDLVFGKILN